MAFVFGSAKARRRPCNPRDAACNPHAPGLQPPRAPGAVTHPSSTTLSQGWSPFRCFPEESYPLSGSSCRASLSVSACGEARSHCLVLQCAGAEVTISMGDAAEAAAWLEAAPAAAAARGAAPPPPRQPGGGGGEGGGGGARQETRRLEARAAAAREELALVTSEAARVRAATARTLGDCAYVLQVHRPSHSPPTRARPRAAGAEGAQRRGCRGGGAEEGVQRRGCRGGGAEEGVQRRGCGGILYALPRPPLHRFLGAPLTTAPYTTAPYTTAPYTAAPILDAGADGQARGRDRRRRQR